MSVDIHIDLDATAAKAELVELKSEIEALEERLDLSLDSGDIGDTIDDLTDALDEAAETFAADLDEAAKRLENLDLDDITIQEVQAGDGDSGGDTGSDSGDSGTPSKYLGGSGRRQRRSDVYNKRFGTRLSDTIEQVMDRASMDRSDSWFMRDRLQTDERLGAFQRRMREKGGFTKDTATSIDMDSFDVASYKRRGAKIADGFKPDRMHGIRGPIEKLNKAVGRLTPSMSTFYKIVAMLAPVIVTVAGAAVGLAAALGAVAVAGASIIGLGLLGHGDDLASSFEEAKAQVKEFGQEMFEVFQPAAEVFAPIQDEFFDYAPTQMGELVDELENFASFGDALFSMWDALVGGITAFFEVINRNEAAVRQLSARFGEIIGSNLLGFFEWSIQMLDQNQDMFVQLGKMVKIAMGAIWDISMAISYMASHFEFLMPIVEAVGNLLNTSVGSGLLTVVAGLYMATKAGMAFMAVLTTLNGLTNVALVGGLMKAFTALQAYTFKMITATGATYGLAHAISTLMATTGIGALLMLGGLGVSHLVNSQMDSAAGSHGTKQRPAASSGGRTIVNNEGDTYNVQVNGDMDTASRERVLDEMQRTDRRSAVRNQDINKPGPDATK